MSSDTGSKIYGGVSDCGYLHISAMAKCFSLWMVAKVSCNSVSCRSLSQPLLIWSRCCFCTPFPRRVLRRGPFERGQAVFPCRALTKSGVDSNPCSQMMQKFCKFRNLMHEPEMRLARSPSSYAEHQMLTIHCAVIGFVQ